MNIVSCGILKNELNYLIDKNGWDVDAVFLDSSLHIDFDKLYRSLDGVLSKIEEPVSVVYGTCHPLIDGLVSGRGGIRTNSQNCIEMLLGAKSFNEYLSQGAFFLLEDWAKRWDEISQKAFGMDENAIRKIFRGEHKFFLCINTPCSGAFAREAELIGAKIGLPLRWVDVGLDAFELCLLETFRTIEKRGSPDE